MSGSGTAPSEALAWEINNADVNRFRFLDFRSIVVALDFSVCAGERRPSCDIVDVLCLSSFKLDNDLIVLVVGVWKNVLFFAPGLFSNNSNGFSVTSGSSVVVTRSFFLLIAGSFSTMPLFSCSLSSCFSFSGWSFFVVSSACSMFCSFVEERSLGLNAGLAGVLIARSFTSSNGGASGTPFSFPRIPDFGGFLTSVSSSEILMTVSLLNRLKIEPGGAAVSFVVLCESDVFCLDYDAQILSQLLCTDDFELEETNLEIPDFSIIETEKKLIVIDFAQLNSVTLTIFWRKMKMKTLRKNLSLT